MNFNIYLLIGIFFFLLNTFSLKIILPYLKKFLPDKPNARSSHQKEIPRGGGITFVFFTLTYKLFTGSLDFLIFIPLLLISLIDDFYKISRRLRYSIHCFTAFAMVITSNVLNRTSIDNFYLNTLFIIFLVIFLTSIINFINFMDGIDGLVGGFSLVFFINASLLGFEYQNILIASLLGFLMYNWHPAKVFMGDIGSTFLGALIGYSIIMGDSFAYSFKLLLIASPLIFDAFICILRRAIYNQNIFQAHSLHLYQRLVKAGWSHSNVSILYISSSIFISFINLIFGIKISIFSIFLIFVFGFYLDQKKAVPFQ